MFVVVFKHILVIMFCIMWATVWSGQHCKDYDISKTILGYRCPDGFETAQNLTVPRHVCILYCVGKVQCRMLSFGETGQSCFLYKEPCVKTKRDFLFRSLLLQDVAKRDCISWIPYEGIVPLDRRILHRTGGQTFLTPSSLQ